MALLSKAAVLLGKELRTEFRSRELLTTTVVFILTIVDRKSTRLNSSHSQISYAVFCLKKKRSIRGRLDRAPSLTGRPGRGSTASSLYSELAREDRMARRSDVRDNLCSTLPYSRDVDAM